jgi:hypothetical protein
MLHAFPAQVQVTIAQASLFVDFFFFVDQNGGLGRVKHALVDLHFYIAGSQLRVLHAGAGVAEPPR